MATQKEAAIVDPIGLYHGLRATVIKTMGRTTSARQEA